MTHEQYPDPRIRWPRRYGEAMCRNLVRKSGLPVAVYDIAEAPMQRLSTDGARRACLAGRSSGERRFLLVTRSYPT